MMRVFVAGASGAIGTRLVPQLLDRGHEVIGTFKSPGNAERVRALGAEPIALDLLDPTPPATTRETNAAMRYLDQAVTDAGGIALRHGGFYGASNDGLLGPVRKRQFPIVGNGGGVSSFIHLDDAAAATVLALEHDRAGIYNIVDDEPAPAREWLPVLANLLGAKPPRHVPVWLARLVAGEFVVTLQ